MKNAQLPRQQSANKKLFRPPIYHLILLLYSKGMCCCFCCVRSSYYIEFQQPNIIICEKDVDFNQFQRLIERDIIKEMCVAENLDLSIIYRLYLAFFCIDSDE